LILFATLQAVAHPFPHVGLVTHGPRCGQCEER
jgi:hypothetical protein